MSQMVKVPSEATSQSTGRFAHSIRWGLPACVVAAAISYYGAYGDPHPKASQENAVPFLIVVDVVVALLLFGLLVPAALKLVATSGAWRGIALGAGILGIIATPVAAWSGVPLLLGATAAVIARGARGTNGAGKLATSAYWVGVVAMVLSTAMVVIGNTVLSS